MLFNSLKYAVFLPIVVIAYFLLPSRFRWIFLLAVSYFFYMCWNAKYALLMMASTIITYFASILMDKSSKKRLKTFYLVSSLVVNLGILFLLNIMIFLMRHLQLL